MGSISQNFGDSGLSRNACFALKGCLFESGNTGFPALGRADLKPGRKQKMLNKALRKKAKDLWATVTRTETTYSL